MSSNPAKTLEELLKGMPTFKVVGRHAQTREERDDQGTIFGAKSYADLTREVLKRAPVVKPDEPVKK